MKDEPNSDNQPLGVPPSEFHPERPVAPFKKRGNVKTVILVAILIVVLDLLIYFFLIRPDDTQLLKVIEPLKPQETTIVPTNPKPSLQTAKRVSDLAIKDLAKRLSIPEKDINVVSEETVTWNDGSLGCPQPDMMYTQSLVEGTKVVLSAQQKNFDYHARTDGTPFLCEKQTK